MKVTKGATAGAQDCIPIVPVVPVSAESRRLSLAMLLLTLVLSQVGSRAWAGRGDRAGLDCFFLRNHVQIPKQNGDAINFHVLKNILMFMKRKLTGSRIITVMKPNVPVVT